LSSTQWDVQPDVMTPRAPPKVFGIPVVVFPRTTGNLLQVLRI
jgi:hypothetical protein